MFAEAAQHGYIPAKEKVAWYNILSSTTEEELIEARKAFEELVPLGRSDSQMVSIDKQFINHTGRWKNYNFLHILTGYGIYVCYWTRWFGGEWSKSFAVLM